MTDIFIFLVVILINDGKVEMMVDKLPNIYTCETIHNIYQKMEEYQVGHCFSEEEFKEYNAPKIVIPL